MVYSGHGGRGFNHLALQLTRFARVVFALLVAASFGAFFVAQRLKGAESVAEITQRHALLLAQRRRTAATSTGSRSRSRRRARRRSRSSSRRRSGAAAHRRHRRAAGHARARGVGRADRRGARGPRRPLPDAGRAAAQRPDGDRRRLLQRRHDRAEAGRAVGHAADRRAGAGGVSNPRPRRRAPPRPALPRPAHRREPGAGGRPLPRPRGQPPRRLGRPRGRRPGAAGHLHRRRVGPRPLRQRGHGARGAAAGPGPDPRQAGDHGAPDHRPAAARARARRAARRVLRRLAAAVVPLERPPGRDRAHDQEGRRGAGAPARHPRPAGGVGRVPAAAAVRPLQRQRPVPRPGARAGAAAGRRPGRHVARRRQGRRRRRRPAQHARDRRSREVAARDRRRQGDAGDLRRPDRAAARLPRPRAHPLRPHLRHRAEPLARPAGHRPRGRDPGRHAALGRALAGTAAAGVRRGRWPPGELRHRQPAARGARRVEPPDAAHAADADGPVRGAPGPDPPPPHRRRTAPHCR